MLGLWSPNEVFPHEKGTETMKTVRISVVGGANEVFPHEKGTETEASGLFQKGVVTNEVFPHEKGTETVAVRAAWFYGGNQ